MLGATLAAHIPKYPAHSGDGCNNFFFLVTFILSKTFYLIYKYIVLRIIS